MAEKYYLTPGSSICKIGKQFKGRKIEVKASKDEYKLLSDEAVKAFEKNIPFMLEKGKIITASDYAKLAEKEDDNNSGKSEKRIQLETQAKELDIEFEDSITQKDLKSLIDAKLAEKEEDK